MTVRGLLLMILLGAAGIIGVALVVLYVAAHALPQVP